MAALKWIVVVLCSLGAVGSLGLGFMEGGVPASTTAPPALAPLAMRALPPLPSVAAAAPAPAPADAPKPADDAKPAGDEPPRPAGDAKPADEPKAPAAAAEKPADPEPVAAKPPAPAPVAKPPAPKPAPAAADGTMNLRASDTADVYVDGKKVGGSPVVGLKAKAGTHRVRFDCYDAAGNAIAGPVKTVTVKADEEQDVDFTCPDAE